MGGFWPSSLCICRHFFRKWGPTCCSCRTTAYRPHWSWIHDFWAIIGILHIFFDWRANTQLMVKIISHLCFCRCCHAFLPFLVCQSFFFALFTKSRQACNSYPFSKWHLSRYLPNPESRSDQSKGLSTNTWSFYTSKYFWTGAKNIGPVLACSIFFGYNQNVLGWTKKFIFLYMTHVQKDFLSPEILNLEKDQAQDYLGWA